MKHPFDHSQLFTFSGVNHMAVLHDRDVFDVLRHQLGVTCGWAGIWATSVGHLIVPAPVNTTAILVYVTYQHFMIIGRGYSAS